MTKRPRDQEEIQFLSKRFHSAIVVEKTPKKRPLVLLPFTPDKRRKIHEYWHSKPHTREERAAYMATIYEHLLCH